MLGCGWNLSIGKLTAIRFAPRRFVRAFAIAVALLSATTCFGAANPPAGAEHVAESILLSPPMFDGKPIPVALEMRITNISDIDEVSQHYKIVGYLIAEWKDQRLAFTPSAPWDKYHSYSPSDVWCPHFDFVNAIVPHAAYDVSIRAYPDGTVRYMERSSAELSNTFRLKTFPFDRQRLEILIHPGISEADTVDFVDLNGGRSFSAEPRVYSEMAQWTLTGMTSSVDRIPGIGGEMISQVRFAILIERRYNFYIWKVFLPLVIMVILSWTVFWLDTSELSAQATISVTTILTVIAFAFAIQANLPKVSYLTFIDVFFLIAYLFVFLTALEIVAVHLAGRSGKIARARRLSGLSRIVLPATYVFLNMLVVIYYFG
jgi:hypothetical protein